MRNQHLQTLLEKEYSRKEFLGLSALSIGSIFGLGALLRLLTSDASSPHVGADSQGGYGRSDYGGQPDSKGV